MWNNHYHKDWWKPYMGKPWAAVPNPPHSYTCGELVRSIYMDIHRIDAPLIIADPLVLRQCISAMKCPEIYGIDPLPPHAQMQEFDVVFLCRGTHSDHMGLMAHTEEGMQVMHCQQNIGVTLDSVAELYGLGWRKIVAYRHKEAPTNA